MRLLRRDDYQRMPWKNGKGLTEEVLVHPLGADLARFDWRISIAHVGADGPFSLFPGIDRSIALLDGDGLCLQLPDGEVELTADGPPYSFSGATVTSSRNRGGATIDLNVMTRRGRFRHRMERSTVTELTLAEAGTILFFNAATALVSRGARVDIGRFDAIVVEAGDPPLSFASPTEILTILLMEDPA